MKRILSVLLVLSMILVLGACSKQGSRPSEITAETRTVTDVWGRKVEVPYAVKKIVTLGSGGPRLAAYLGVMDLLVGVEEHDNEGMNILRDYSPVYFDKIKDLPVVGAGGGSGSNNGYAEQIITAAPDVILAGFSAEAADELQRQTGIPVVSVRYISKGLANESFYDAMRTFAAAVGAEARCEQVLKYIDECKADLAKRTEGIADETKLKVYTGAVTFSGRHGFSGTYSKFGPFDAIHALNVADTEDQDGYYEADLEKIMIWDPDVIFLDPGNMNLVNDEYKTNPNYYDSLRAVKEGNVYTMPSFNNCGMNITYALLNAYYAGSVLFPEAFSDVKIEEKGAEILKAFLGADFFNIMEENGLYYGKITIGE